MTKDNTVLPHGWKLTFFTGLSTRIYKVAGFPFVDGAPIVDAGTGFFINVTDDKRFFIMTLHQYENSLAGCLASALPHNGATVEGHNLTLEQITIFNDLEGSGDDKSDHIILRDLDIVAIPMPITTDGSIRVFRPEFLWETNKWMPFHYSFDKEVVIIGYPNVENGKPLYDKFQMQYSLHCHSSAKWALERDGNISIDLIDSVGTDIDFNEQLQGLSGSPVFSYKQCSENLTKATYDVALQAVVTHINEFTHKVYAVPFKAILKGIGISAKFHVGPYIEGSTVKFGQLDKVTRPETKRIHAGTF